MKTISAVAFVLALAAGTASAQENATLSELASASGLSEREVAMVIGPSTAHAAYRTSYARCKEQLVRSIGQKRYEQVAANYRNEGRRVASQRKAT